MTGMEHPCHHRQTPKQAQTLTRDLSYAMASQLQLLRRIILGTIGKEAVIHPKPLHEFCNNFVEN